MRRRLFILWAVAISAVASGARADTLDDARNLVRTQHYNQAYSALLDYRKGHGGSLEVDYLLGASACRSQDARAKAWGLEHLKATQTSYAASLSRSIANQGVLTGQIAQCQQGSFTGPVPFMTTTIALAKPLVWQRRGVAGGGVVGVAVGSGAAMVIPRAGVIANAAHGAGAPK